MTFPDENVTPEPGPTDEEVLAPATPGAHALPLPEDEVDESANE